MLHQWAPALVYLGISLLVPVAMLGAAAILRVRGRSRTAATTDNYECGEEPDGAAWVRFHPRYYIVALVFVVFDIEAAFLFPWALKVGDMGLIAVIDMFVFLAILLVGWAYAVRKGAIKWV
ncbi:MAG: NADH-quinone oxidoreductase subunit A [Deltaproteobacteria bacterium]|nr:NADH-quinone oxidoreductase subunit A [Deltaproteobacteria bacterium]